MTKEETLLAKRFVDLSRQAQQKGIVIFSEFLNLNELNIFRQEISNLHSSYDIFGGYELSERQMIAFIPDALCYTWNYPISCLKITPVNKKFAEALSHRDVLGSFMSLGIERSKLGDILLDETVIYVFCQEKLADFFCSELTSIRHTTVKIEPFFPNDLNLLPKTETAEGVIASNRLDSIIACICKVSRSLASQWIKEGKVFLNNRETLHPSAECQAGTLISVRSIGRFRFLECLGETRKGRLKIKYDKYI
ncbi:MAG: hypothetical protein HFI70_02455 [Lachnospiraceae bacterium]|nr:hypothetical protein [Lachnospiraceae bacterium]